MISRERLRQADRHARRRLLLWWNPVTGEQFTEWQRMRKTTKRCSCYMCGNPRKHFGQRTWQEMKKVDDNYGNDYMKSRRPQEDENSE